MDERTKQLLDRAKAFLDDIPKIEMSESGQQSLFNDPENWLVATERNVKAALANGDEEIVDVITNDVAHFLGSVSGAEAWRLKVWGDMVRENQEKKQDNEE